MIRYLVVITLFFVSQLCIAQSEIPSETAMQKHCLALNIYHEARGEVSDYSYENWLVVAMITRNRIDNPYYPDSWCKVIYQPFQYSWTHDGKPDEPNLTKKSDARAWEEINVFVEGFLANHRHIKDPTMGAIDYAACYVDNHWTRAYDLFKTFNNHCVYHRG